MPNEIIHAVYYKELKPEEKFFIEVTQGNQFLFSMHTSPFHERLRDGRETPAIHYCYVDTQKHGVLFFRRRLLGG